MDAQDLRSVMTTSELPPPEEAASNINRSNIHEISPDTYHDLKAELEPKIIANERVPASMEPATKEFVTQSKQHLAVAQDDLHAMNDTESHLTYHYNKTFEIPNKQRQRNAILREQMFSVDGELSPEKEEMAQDLNASIDEMSKGEPKDMGNIEKFSGDVASGLVDIGRSYKENLGLMGGMIGGGAAVASGVGALVGGGLPGAVIGAGVGATSGLASAMAVVPMVDSFMETSASVYGDLKYGTKDDGTPLNIPHTKRALVAMGVGVVSGAAAHYGGKMLAESNPFLKKFLDPKAASKYVIGNPGLMSKLEIIGSMIHAGKGEAVEEFVQQLAETVGTDLAKVDNTEESFMNSVGNLANKFKETMTSGKTYKDAGYAALVGFGAGAGAGGATNIPTYGVMKAQYQKAQDVSRQKKEVLSTQNMMIDAAASMHDTKLQKLSPAEAKSFKAKLFDKIGIEPNAWFSTDDLEKFANTPDKASKIQQVLALNPEMVKLAKDTNSHIQLSKAEVLDIMTEHPDIADYMRLHPEGQNPLEVRNEAKTFADNLSKADALRAKLMEKIGAIEDPAKTKAVLDEALGPLKESPYFQSRDQYAAYDPIKTMTKTPEQIDLELQHLGIKEKKKDLKAQIKKGTETGMDPAGIEQLNKELSLLEDDHKNVKEKLKPYKGLLSDKEITDLNNAHLDARMQIDKLLTTDVDERFQRYEDSEFKQQTDVEVEQEQAKLEKENRIIDNFTKPHADPEVAAEYTKTHKKKGFSAFAIDPNSLSVSQRAMYYDNNNLTPTIKNNLKKRKAFVEGGLKLEEAALLNGVEDGETLLKILAETPTKKQVEERVRKDPVREAALRQKIQENNESARLQAIDESFSKVTNLHLKEMDQMKNRSWNTVKRGIIKLAGKVPTLQEVNIKAKDTVKGMKIRDLNANQFKQGEASSQKLAVKQFVDGQVEAAFGNKGKAALNSELMKETLKAREKVAKNQKFWKRLMSESNIQELKDAGYHDAVNEFMSAYKLEGAIPNEGQQKSFNAFVKRQAELGNIIPTIPDKLNNTQASFKDLTVEQYTAITDFGQFMLKQAQLKNQLFQSQKQRKDFRTLERVAEESAKLTEAHPDFDPERAKREDPTSKVVNETQKIKNSVKSISSAFKNSKHIISKLDQHKLGGFFYKTFMEPLVESVTGKKATHADIVNDLNNVIKEHYGDQKNYLKAMSERISIAEFSNIDSLNNGDMSKVQLLRMMAFMGDPDGRERLGNFVDSQGAQLDFDTLSKVMDREVTTNEAKFVEKYFVNPYKRLKNPYFEMHKRVTGVDTEMKEGVPFVHKGIVYEGGYQPLDYQRTPDDIKEQQMLDRANDHELLDNESEFFAKRRAAEMTKQGRSKERVGSNRPLDLELKKHFDAIEEIVHDIHFRETGIDMLKLLKNPTIIKSMKSVVGPKDFGVLFDSVKDVISKTSEKDSSVIHKEQNAKINSAVGFMKSLHSIKTIGFNLASMAVQADSLFYVPLRTGPKTALYLTKNFAKLAANSYHWKEMVNTAQVANPDIKFEQDAIDDSFVKSNQGLIPYGETFMKEYQTLGKGLTAVKQLRKKIIDASFYPLSLIDKMNKVVHAVSISDQFFSGDIEGFELDKLDKMSDAEKLKTLQSIVKQSSDLSLTANSTLDKTSFEKHAMAKIFANYWVDGRSRLNTFGVTKDKVKWSVKKGDYNSAASELMLFALVAGVSGAYVSAIRGRDDEESKLDKLKKVHSTGDAALLGFETMYDTFMSPMMDSIPVVNTVKYAAETNLHYKGAQIRPVSVPVVAVLSDAASGVVSLSNLMIAAIKGKRTHIKPKDRKALLTLGGFISGGAPTNTVNKLIDIAGNKSNQRKVKEYMDDFTHFRDVFKVYKEEFKDDPHSQQFIEDMTKHEEALPKFEAEATQVIPEGTKESIKKTLSGGDWTKYNEETGAAGVYQFTEDRWKALMIAHPDLGLTENGRVAKDPAQQEKAMDRETEESTKSLIAYELPVSKENILGVHMFGFDNLAKIAEASDDKKLSEVIGDEAKKPEFKNFSTVGDVKKYLSRSLKD